eukprot:1257178-Prymnesium_polylepis.1
MEIGMLLGARKNRVRDDDKLRVRTRPIAPLSDQLDVTRRRVWPPQQELAAPLLEEHRRRHHESRSLARGQAMQGDCDRHRRLAEAHLVREEHAAATCQRKVDGSLLILVKAAADERRVGRDGRVRAQAEGGAQRRVPRGRRGGFACSLRLPGQLARRHLALEASCLCGGRSGER